ncbi:hypothetical protein SPRG_12476 [Saprolegnia parasitica CBS 223.65]|uniref:Uncharacterized protein n=1 Tax=Saprolegnia parasitica (strain CBS 223.65) TaxID=695850 RepID=A0A067C3W8_SAPPC|nr:hypothetical protein SPRG_12476 [Saprolegnia parasitica CBS 223.65]KDO21512.1 hypothetical protein SPRG_12476 [Saprolegnia parasitica CBS 223.65]|eukprot:XP_012207779.1 hypothetical protein SPRG_12476 [Saprolegnia parasitica CBS 223.65]
MAPKAKQEKKAEPTRRMGPWTPEEVAYTHRLSQDFQLGLLEDVRQGMSLRQWLSHILNCSPMRISKKFEVEPSLRARCNYVVNWQRIKSLTPHEVYVRKKELETLERNFKKSTESQDYVRLMQSMRNCYDKYRKGKTKSRGAKRGKGKEPVGAPPRKKNPRRCTTTPAYDEATSPSSASSPTTSSTLSPPSLPMLPPLTAPPPRPSFLSSKQPLQNLQQWSLPARRDMVDRLEIHAVFHEYLVLMQELQTTSADVRERLSALLARVERMSVEQGMTPLTIGVLNSIRAGLCIAEALTPTTEETLNDSSAIETLLRLSRA